ncbi:MAG: energy transducer TonB [Candidatus Acidiferrum sp.]
MSTSSPVNPSARSPLSSSVVSSVPRTQIPRKQVLEIHLSPSYRPVLFNLPGERTLASPSVTMRIQRSIRIPAAQAGWPFNRNKKVEVGDLVSHADPNASRRPIVNGADSVRVMATVAKDGTVERVRPIFGPANLIPAVAKALHQWRYQPTLVDGKPVETQCYVVIQFHEPEARSAN